MVDLVPGTKIIYTPSGFMENLEFIQPQPEGNTQIFYLKKQEIINITPISETIESQVDGTILGVPEPVTVQTTRIQADLKIYKNYARWIPINSIWGGGFGSVFFAWDPFAHIPTPKPVLTDKEEVKQWGVMKREYDVITETLIKRERLIEVLRSHISLLKTRDAEREGIMEQLFLIRETGERETINAKASIQDLTKKLDLAFATIDSLESVKSLSEDQIKKFKKDFKSMRDLVSKLDESIKVMGSAYDIIERYYSKTAEITKSIEDIERKVVTLQEKMTEKKEIKEVEKEAKG